MHEITYYLGAALSAAIYAAILQIIGRERYEPDFTVVTVMVGVALTGGWVAIRFIGLLPELPADQLVWWCWRVMFQMFIATGLPITTWQIWQARRRIADLASYLTRSRNDTQIDQANQAAAVAAKRREPPPTDH